MGKLREPLKKRYSKTDRERESQLQAPVMLIIFKKWNIDGKYEKSFAASGIQFYKGSNYRNIVPNPCNMN